MRLAVPFLILLTALVPATLLVGGAALARDGLAFSGAIGAGLFGAAGLFVPGGARFSSPAEVLRHDVRQRMHTLLLQGPGASLTQLTQRLDLTATNALWHLRKLEQAGLVRSRRFHGTTMYYVVEGGVGQREMTERAAVLNGHNARELVAHVLENPGVHQRELARVLDVNPGTIRWHVRKLVDAGLIEERIRGCARAYYATPAARAALGTTADAAAAAAASAEPGLATLSTTARA